MASGNCINRERRELGAHGDENQFLVAIVAAVAPEISCHVHLLQTAHDQWRLLARTKGAVYVRGISKLSNI